MWLSLKTADRQAGSRVGNKHAVMNFYIGLGEYIDGRTVSSSYV